jgi:hypothetical protein
LLVHIFHEALDQSTEFFSSWDDISFIHVQAYQLIIYNCSK